MKHIALVIPTIHQIGGAERQVLLLAEELSARGWRVTLIALSGPTIAPANIPTDAGFAYFSLDMRKGWIDPRGWLRYLRWARRNRPDIVHSHLPHATWFARWVRLVAPVPVLIDTIHTSSTRGAGRRLGYRCSNWLSNQITCVSHSVAEAVVTAGMIPEAQLSVLPNGVVVPQQVADIPPDSRPPTSFLWIAVGRLAPVKDYPTLLRAFATLIGHPRLLIAGGGPDDLPLRTLAMDLNVEDRVQFAGFQQHIQPLLDASDAFVQSSLWEGLPVSILEAQAAGLPVVATNAAGTAEALIPGLTGLLVPVGDSGALSCALAEIMDMPKAERRRMGARGRRFVEENFSLKVVVDRWESLYAKLLVANRFPARQRS